MKRSEQILALAARVRLGESIDWQAESDAMALEQVASDARYAEDLKEQSSRQLERLSGVSNRGSEAQPDGGGQGT